MKHLNTITARNTITASSMPLNVSGCSINQFIASNKGIRHSKDKNMMNIFKTKALTFHKMNDIVLSNNEERKNEGEQNE